MYGYCGIARRIDSGTYKHSMSDISLFSSWGPGDANVTFNTDVGTTITPRVVGTVDFKALDFNGDERIVTLDGAYCVTQSLSRVDVGQLTRCVTAQWESPGFNNRS